MKTQATWVSLIFSLCMVRPAFATDTYVVTFVNKTAGTQTISFMTGGGGDPDDPFATGDCALNGRPLPMFLVSVTQQVAPGWSNRVQVTLSQNADPEFMPITICWADFTGGGFELYDQFLGPTKLIVLGPTEDPNTSPFSFSVCLYDNSARVTPNASNC